ncbi:MAG: DsrE family protein [Tunicatimonas sp.]
MKKLLNLSYPLPVVLLGWMTCLPHASVAQSDQELIINLTSDATANAHSTLMGLHLGQTALKNDIPVTVFLNVDGVKLMTPGSDTLSFEDENLHQVLKDITKAGGTVIACPHCLKTHQLSEDDLMEGVRLSDEKLLLDKIKQSPTVFTY